MVDILCKLLVDCHFVSPNLSTVFVLWGIYSKKCISLVRICLQTRKDARTEFSGNASTKFRKTLGSKDLVKYSAYAECEIISLPKL